MVHNAGIEAVDAVASEVGVAAFAEARKGQAEERRHPVFGVEPQVVPARLLVEGVVGGKRTVVQARNADAKVCGIAAKVARCPQDA